MKPRTTAAALVAAGAMLVAGGAAAGTAVAASVPGKSWKAVAPAEAGLDAARLGQIAQTAEAGSSNCLLVARDGRLAGEWDFRGTGPDTAQDVFSMTKSITSTLVGIAQDDGDLRIGDRASKWIAEWRGTPSAAVTVRDLLSNDSGRQWSPAIDYQQLLAAPNRTAFAIGLGQASPPGSAGSPGRPRPGSPTACSWPATGAWPGSGTSAARARTAPRTCSR
jgi:CubicO group peptidase (beta-lactamase class C family)